MKRTYKKTPTVFQMEATECGAASLSMIFAYFGKHLPLEQMRIETGVSRDGCNAGNMMRAAKKYGLECHGYRKELNSLLEIETPCIIHWNFNHFVVFEGIKNGHAYLNDPAVGRRKLTIEELDDGFTGVVLTFKTTDKFEKQKKQNNIFGFVNDRLHGQYNVLVKLFFIGLLLVFPGLILPVASQILLDDVIVGGNTDWFSTVIWCIVLLIAMQAGLTYYRGIILQKLQNKMVLLSLHKFVSHMFRLPIGFFDQRYTGDLAGRVDNNNNVNVFLSGELAETVLNIFVAAFYLILLIVYSPTLTLIGIVSIVINIIIVKISSEYLSNASMKMQQDSGKLSGAVCAGINITSTLKASGTENDYVGRLLGYYAKTAGLEQKLSKFQQILNVIPQIASLISSVLVLMLGGLYVIDGIMTIGMLVAFDSLLSSFTAPVNSLVGFVQEIQTLKADLNRVDDIVSYGEDTKFETTTKLKQFKSKLSGHIELKDIAFGYSKLEAPLIENFNFTLTPGSSIAFVGPSGCGKSTVSKIVSGLYTQWDGKIKFDGVTLNEIPKEVINASISTVSQSITLFSGTIRDNITMWNNSILESDIIRAAKDACIHDVITQKPCAYEFNLTEGATNLSGGQRQRLEIARALVTNPSILIMDEATSALDPIVEKKILDNIKRRGCTCIIVAHRLSAIRDCDQIIVMKRGKIIQHGTHDELANVEGAYQTLIKNI